MWGEGTPRYRVVAGRGETRAPRGARSVAYRARKLTADGAYSTVPTAVTARDRTDSRWAGPSGGTAATKGMTR
ncbi:hypothetical protein SSP531S_29560 [Streptomyces spongiicola]|uniref:Uncharacterized protein n=1 Tax=Streptomyces spongiicola TaxID=1690221 RepID=A0A388T069_9ACTN|nr:hypothetical protein SSP531S_29560 [Streptomyces spongiicola]